MAIYYWDPDLCARGKQVKHGEFGMIESLHCYNMEKDSCVYFSDITRGIVDD